MTTTSSGRARPVPAGLLWLVPTLLVAMAVGMYLTGESAPQLLSDPGVVVRWGLPVAKAVADLGAAGTIGAMLLAAAVLPPSSEAWGSAVRIGAGAAMTWTVAAVAVLVLTYADVAGRPVGAAEFGAELGFFVANLDLGRLLLLTALFAAGTATVAIGVRRPGGAALTVVLALVSLVPIALTGHATGSADHETAVTGWWLHVVGISAWLGGLAVLAALARGLGAALPAAARRYSAIAGWAFTLVVISGVVSAWLRLGAPSDLLTGYGLLILLKTGGTVLLGVAGWWHRRSLLPGLDGGPDGGAAAGGTRRAFWRLVSGELVLFGAVTGLAVALASSSPPVPGVPPSQPTPAELLTGEALPAPPTAVRWVTETNPDLLWLLVAAALALAYVVGVRRLWMRGDRWPVGRTALWLAGCVVLVYLTSGAPASYGRTLFSIHMVQHMALSMVVPPLLVGGAPVTLALRALRRRSDGSYGPREWLLLVVESREARFVSHPVVAAVLFAGSIVVFYFSPLFELALSTHVGHEVMTAHFLLAGYLFANALVGVDPGPSRPAYPLRLLLLFGTMAFHAFFGVSLLSGDALLAADWFSSTGWGIDALADQREGGAIAWGIGELPTLVLALVVAVQWSRSDDREARRTDRAADRDSGAELAEYNAMLSRLEQRGPRS